MGEVVWRNVSLVDPGLSSVNSHEAIPKLSFSKSHRLDFGSFEFYSGFEGLHDLIVMTCLPILCHDLDAGRGRLFVCFKFFGHRASSIELTCQGCLLFRKSTLTR